MYRISNRAFVHYLTIFFCATVLELLLHGDNTLPNVRNGRQDFVISHPFEGRGLKFGRIASFSGSQDRRRPISLSNLDAVFLKRGGGPAVLLVSFLFLLADLRGEGGADIRQ